MTAARGAREQATLFELDLDDEAAGGDARDEALELPLSPAPSVAPHRVAAAAAAPAGASTAPFRARLFAGLVDLGVHVAVAAAALGGARAMEVEPALPQLPAFALLVLVFSLFYTVVPLAFWGKTPGMAAVGLVCQAGDDLPLTFAEALRRWLGELVTVLLIGLPGLAALGAARRSLADRWSGSELVVD
ncbi:MAG TPA: RDD family protein [Thermoanaerobaculia bacterium]|nr:RDD family protein [Thermoanaerobaculia bacterium]